MAQVAYACSISLVLLAACGNDTGGGAVDSGVADATPVDGVSPQEVRFQRDVVPIFNRGCGNTSTGCHARNIYGATSSMECMGWLSLENASIGSKYYGGPNNGQATGCPDRTLHERILELGVWQCRNAPRQYVVAGDPAASYLMDKIRGTDLCDVDGQPGTVSNKMPPPPPESMLSLTGAEIETIESWIVAGAKDD